MKIKIIGLDADFVLNALLRHNYFPAQKKNREELPPCFTSKAFTPAIARKLVAVKQRGGDGWDSVEYFATRFNGVMRTLSIPHPLGYAHLCLCIHANWANLRYTASNFTSRIRPRRHKDGRVIIMDYDGSAAKTRRGAKMSFGRRFMVRADITNCFPSIYSHAVSWATVGFATAKAGRFTPALWFNQLDKRIRHTKRNETQGVAIGPATSNIASELILARVDDVLRKKFLYERFIDDYTAYCKSEDEAQEFIRLLAQSLSRYKMLLSIKKTQILPLPQPGVSGWVSRLAAALPKVAAISAYDAGNYLSLAVDMSKETPDGSILKYAVKSLLRHKLASGTEEAILPEILNLAFHQPALMPLLEPLLQATSTKGSTPHQDELVALALENSRLCRSDGLCWALYYLIKFKCKITDDLANSIVASRDCLGLVLLYLSGQAKHKKQVVDFANALDKSDNFELDQYWLLLYQLFFWGALPANPYSGEEAFQTLKANGVSFIV